MTAQRYVFSIILLASMIGFGWVPVVYVLSYHAAAKVIDYADQSFSEPTLTHLR